MTDKKKPDLAKAREEINRVDRQLVEVLAERFRIVERVLSEKKEAQMMLRDKKRETELLGEVVKIGRPLGLDSYFLTRVFQEIIDYSLKLQSSSIQEMQNGARRRDIIRVAFQGIEEAYSHLASRKHFSRHRERMAFRPCATFADVIAAVEEGEADYAVLPVENTTAGSINEVYDLLLRTRLSIVGEEVYEVVHCMSAVADIPLANVRRVYSHPQALAQCSNFLASLENCHVESFADTAESVKKVAEEQDLSQAAIASEEAALAHGLVILKRGIANQKENFTRFFILAPQAVRVDPRIKAKTSMVLATAHREGALARCLNTLSDARLNMTKLESRPRPGTPWEYLFYLDLEGNIEDPSTQAAIEELKKESTFLKVLGTYPALDREKATPSAVDLVESARAHGDEAPKAVLPPMEKGLRLVAREQRGYDSEIRVRGVHISPTSGGQPTSPRQSLRIPAPPASECSAKAHRVQRHAAKCCAPCSGHVSSG